MPCCGIVFVDDQLVEAEIGHKEKAAADVEGHGMGVGAGLAHGVDARALMLDEVGGAAERAVLQDGQHADRAAHKVGDEDVPALMVDDQVAGIRAVGRLLVQEGQAAVGGVDGKGADGPAGGALIFLEFVDGVEEAVGRVKGQVGGVAHAGDHGERFQGPRSDIERIEIDARTFALKDLARAEKNGFGVGADIDQSSV